MSSQEIILFFLLAVYLCKRTMQNKARLELADYEAVSTKDAHTVVKKTSTNQAFGHIWVLCAFLHG